MMDLYPFARALLFRLSAETAHNVSFRVMQGLQTIHCTGLLPRLRWSHPVQAMGLTFDNPLGLAAGLDKNGTCIDALGALGFGFLEIGTVTPRPQPGNPKPRLFRVKEHQVLINRMGFNNHGIDNLVDRAKGRRYGGQVGINIGKNASTLLEGAVDDYRMCYRAAYPHADYIAVNISSPNTKGLRDLQADDALKRILEGLAEEERTCSQQGGRQVPLAVKIAPDLGDDAVAGFVRQIQNFPVSAVIATNTTIDRRAVAGTPWELEAGGLSGAPLQERSNEVIKILRETLPANVSVIGVGGIMSGADAKEKIEAGADLIQIYSGLIYRGPELIREIANAVG